MKDEDREDAREIEKSMADPRPSIPWEKVKKGLGMKVGDEVEWTSQSAGHTTTKRGVIVAVIPPRGRFPDGLKVSRYGGGIARNHESYLVKVEKRGVYWPRVSALKPVGPAARRSTGSIAAVKEERRG